MQFRFLKALGHLKPPWTHFEAHHIRHCLSHHAQPTFDLTCHTLLLILKLSSQLSSELFCSTYKHQPQGPAGVNKWIHFFYVFTNVGIRIQTEGRADWGSMSQNHRMKSYPQQWQLDFNCKFHTEENVWKHQLFWEQKPPPVFAAQQSGLRTPWLSWALAASCGHVQSKGTKGKFWTVKRMLQLGPGAGQLQTRSEAQNIIFSYENKGWKVTLVHMWAYIQQPRELLSLIR